MEASTLSNGAQLSANIRLATAFLRAERFGDEQAYDGLVCAPPAPLVNLAGAAASPLTAAVALDPARLRLSLVGAPGDVAVIYAGAGPGRGVTPDGIVGLASPVEVARLALAEEAACAEVSLPPELAGVAWLQVVHVRADGINLARVIDLFGADADAPDTGEGLGDTAALPGDEDRAIGASGGCGCATGQASINGAGLLALTAPLGLLSLVSLRRRP